MNAVLNLVIRTHGARAAQAQIAGLSSAAGTLSAATAATATKAGRLGGMMPMLAGGFAAARGGAMNFFNGLGNGVLRLEKFGKNLQWTGRQIEFNFTLPILAAGGAATKWALDLDRAQIRMAKVYGEMGADQEQMREEVEALQEAFRHLSEIFGVHQDEVLGIAAAWAQAGSAGPALARQVRTTLEMMILGSMEAADATEALITVQAAYQLSSEELTLAIGQLNAVENNTTASMPNLIKVISTAGGVAREAGVPITELAAMTASLVPAAGGAAESGNSLKTIITRLMSPTSAATDLMRGLGIEVGESEWQSANFTERLFILRDALEDVNTAQRNIVLTEVAGRRQVSRMMILLRDIANEQGRYAKAIEVTSDEMLVMNQYHQEIATVLGSSSRGFSILSVMMRNALVEAITPMIPAILALMHRLVGIIQAFGQLNPVTQQWILLGLGMLAVMGPIIRTMGAAVQVFTRLARVLINVGKLLTGVIAFALHPWALVLGGIALLVWAFRDSVGEAIFSLEKVWYRLPETVRSVLSAVISMVQSAAQAISNFFASIFGLGRGTSPAPQPRGTRGTPTAMQSGGEVPGRGTGDKIPALLEPKEFVVRRDGSNLADALSYYGVPGYQAGGAVASAQSVLRSFERATAGARRRFQQAERDETRRIILQFSPGAGPSISAMYSSIDRLNSSLNTLDRQITNQEAVVARWQRRLDEANRVLDAAQKRLRDKERVLSSLRDAARAAQNALGDATNVLRDLERTPIKGMQAMSDAIFENEMAQRGLRLEILRLEEAEKPIDDVRSKLSRLQGDIERLRSDREELRLAGAGSDILNVLDTQINEMEKARREAEAASQSGGPSSEIEELRKELEDLRRTGEILDLERSLKFDPLTRQIEQVTRGMEEMPFDQLMREIKSQQREVARLETEWLKAEEAVRKQERTVDAQRNVVEALTDRRDAVRDTFNVENQRLTALNEQYRAIESQIRSMEQAMSDLESGARSAIRAQEEAARAAEAAARAAADAARAASRAATGTGARAATGAAGRATGTGVTGAGAGAGGAGPALPPHMERFEAAALGEDFEIPGGEAIMDPEGGVDEIRELAEQWAKEVADQLGSLEFFQPLRDTWDRTIQWLVARWNALKTWWDGLNFGGGPFGRASQAIETALVRIFEVLGSFAGSILTWIEGFVSFWQGFWSKIEGPVGRLWEELGQWFFLIVDLVLRFVEDVAYYFSAFTDIFGGDFLGTLGEVLGYVLGIVIDVFTNILKFVRNFIEAFLAIIDGDWAALGQALAGMWNALVDTILVLLGALWTGIVNIFGTIWEEIKSVFQRIYDWLVGNSLIPDLVDRIIGHFTRLFERAGEIWRTIRETIVGLVTGMRDRAVEIFRNARERIVGTMQAIQTRITEILGALSNWWTTTWGNIRERAVNRFNDARTNLLTTMANINTFIRNVMEALRNWWSTTWGNIRERAVTLFTSARDTVLRLMGEIDTRIRSILGGIRDFWSNTWGSIRERALTMMSAVQRGIATATSGIRTSFANMRDAVGRIMDNLRSRVATPVNWVINSAYNNGIRRFWNGIASRINMRQLPQINPVRLQTGGEVPGYGSGDRVPAMLEPGEWVLNKKSAATLGVRNLEYLNSLKSPGSLTRADKVWGGDVSLPGLELAKHMVAGIQFLRYGGRVQSTQTWAKSQHGKPYLWGGVGPRGYDCSGFMSAVQNELMGMARHRRRYATGMFAPGRTVSGLRPGLRSGFTVGVVRGNPGHMSGNIGGQWIESRGRDGVVVGPRARPSHHGMYSMRFHLPGAGPYERGTGEGGPDSATRSAFTRIWNFISGLNLTAGNMVTQSSRRMASQVGRGAVNYALSNIPFGGILRNLIGLQHGAIVRARMGGTPALLGEGRYDEAVVPLTPDFKEGMGKTEINIYGNLEFPNINSGEDAEAFIENLKIMVG